MINEQFIGEGTNGVHLGYDSTGIDPRSYLNSNVDLELQVGGLTQLKLDPLGLITDNASTKVLSLSPLDNTTLVIRDNITGGSGPSDPETFTNKTIDSGSNTLTITNAFLTGSNVNDLLGQGVRPTDSPTFAALTTATINGNANLAINANQITATVNQPFGMVLNNTSATFSNELRVENNGVSIVGFGNNNTTNEAYCWTYANQPLKFATNSAERMRIPAAGIANDNSITNILGLQGTSLVYKNNIVDASTTQTLTNKNLSDSTTAIIDVSDATKRILFNASGTTSTATTLTCAQTANQVVTFPDATTTLVGTDAAATLTNKTLDSAGNTLTITNAPLAAANVNTLIDQDIRTSASPTFNGVGYYVSTTKAATVFPISTTSAAGVTTTLLTVPVPTNTSVAIFLYLSARKNSGTIQGYGSYVYDWKANNAAGTVTANNGNNQAKSETATAGAFAGKITPSVLVSTTNVLVNLANTFVDGTLVEAGYIEVLFS